MPTNRKNQGDRPRRKKSGNAMKNKGRKSVPRQMDEDRDRETETPQE